MTSVAGPDIVLLYLLALFHLPRYPFHFLPIVFSLSLFLFAPPRSLLHSSSCDKKTRLLRPHNNERLKSYIEFICRRRRRYELLEIRPAILHVQIPGLANDGGNILSLFNLAACASPRQMYTDDFY